jgi:hypothetical protein
MEIIIVKIMKFNIVTEYKYRLNTILKNFPHISYLSAEALSYLFAAALSYLSAKAQCQFNAPAIDFRPSYNIKYLKGILKLLFSTLHILYLEGTFVLTHLMRCFLLWFNSIQLSKGLRTTKNYFFQLQVMPTSSVLFGI